MMDDYELPTEEILDRFGSDPAQPRAQRFVLKDGEMFCRDGSEEATTYNNYFPRYSSISKYGPLYHEHLQMENGILSFNCYLSEPESEVFCEEQIYRVRPMKLLYYLMDDTMSLNEPPVDNSGIMQV
ncbi:unnamed protein product [Toxocara canis]|uniref:DM10 domain-containing protein n=1 Tax=Toxocara canis TaxID=6265 RepID=A0A183V4M3_TOXCA|nr:unnamed protein product [Toxocara canis]